MEMLREVGYVNGIENYSRIIDGRAPGTRPYTLIDFFKKPFLLIIDESHVSIPQVQGMFNGDRARKETLVEHGFRLPCALDNRPLRYDEFEALQDKVVYVSATPGDYELKKSGGVIVEQVIRPTLLVDPPIEIRPAGNQVDDLIEQLRATVEKKERALVTTLTKKMSENLTEYLDSLDFRVRYLHSEIDTLERTEILRELRKGDFDVLVGINLLREGIDLPEVALVAILDADKEGFLRSNKVHRPDRGTRGAQYQRPDHPLRRYGHRLDQEGGRRKRAPAQQAACLQQGTWHRAQKHFARHPGGNHALRGGGEARRSPGRRGAVIYKRICRRRERGRAGQSIRKLEKEMAKAAAELEFEKAARLRDMILEMRNHKPKKQ